MTDESASAAETPEEPTDAAATSEATVPPAPSEDLEDDTTFPGNVGTLTTKEAVPQIREVDDPEALRVARRAEVNRADGPRETIMRTIERRKGQLRFEEKEHELEERLSPSNIERMGGPDLREVAAVRGIDYQGRSAKGLRKALLADYAPVEDED